MNSSLRAALAPCATLALVGCGSDPGSSSASSGPGPQVLHVFNWSDYIAPDTIANFEKATGIKVTYDVFDSNDVLETRLLAGSSGFDVVVPSASFLERQIKAGVFRKLDPAQLPNLQYMDPEISQRVGLHDPGNEHAVTYMWGTTGIGFNKAQVSKVLGDTPLDSWDFIFNPEQAAKLAGCGISVLDAPDELLKLVLNWMGRDPNSQNPDDLKAAEEKLLAVRPHIRKIHSSQYIDDLANGELCVAVGWSGDILQARDRATEVGRGVEVAYVIPKEGAVMWFDMLAIPADARHPENAHAFINYLMQPEVAAANSNAVNYANANQAAFEQVDEAVRTDAGVYPPPQVKAKLFPALAYDADFTRQMTRMWTRFTTGR